MCVCICEIIKRVLIAMCRVDNYFLFLSWIWLRELHEPAISWPRRCARVETKAQLAVISLWRQQSGGFVSTYYQKAIANYREGNEISGAGREKGV